MKKILSIILAVVLMFGAVPMSGTFKNILGVEADAMETVAGSFDYLVNYIKTKGEKNDEGDYAINSTSTTLSLVYFISASVTYCRKEGSLSFFYMKKSGEQFYCVLMTVGRNSSKYYTSASTGKNYVTLDYVSTEIDPTSYNNGALKYSREELSYTNNDYKKAIYELADDMIKESIKSFDKLLREKVGFGLGNFGFTKIAKTADVPTVSAPTFNYFDSIIEFFKNLFSSIFSIFKIA